VLQAIADFTVVEELSGLVGSWYRRPYWFLVILVVYELVCGLVVGLAIPAGRAIAGQKIIGISFDEQERTLDQKST